MPKIFPYTSFRQCFNRTHDLIFWPLSFINKLATINRYNDEFSSDTFPYTPSILPTWRVAEWWIYTYPTDDLLPYRKSYADVGLDIYWDMLFSKYYLYNWKKAFHVCMIGKGCHDAVYSILGHTAVIDIGTPALNWAKKLLLAPT